MEAKYYLNSQFDTIIDAATKDWNDKLIQEIKVLTTTKGKIDNGNVQDHLREILFRANAVRRRFNEVVALEYRQLLCYHENQEIDTISHLKLMMEQASDAVEFKHRKLEMKIKEYDELSQKLK